MPARIVVAGLLALALAGCTGQTEPVSLPDDDKGDPVAVDDGASSEKVYRWEGVFGGAVGGVVPGRGHVAAGSMTGPQSFQVKPGAVELALELAWTPVPGGVPLDLNLVAWTPQQVQVYNADGLPGVPDAPATLRFTNPEEGQWMAMAQPNGVAAQQAYIITATVTYASNGVAPP